MDQKNIESSQSTNFIRPASESSPPQSQNEVPHAIAYSTSSAPSSSSSHLEEDLSIPWPYLSPFFGPVLNKKTVIERGKLVYKGNIRCRLCVKILSFNTLSNFSLKRHYQKVHGEEKYNDLVAALKGGSKRGRISKIDPALYNSPMKMPKPNIEESSIVNFGQIEAEELFQRVVVDQMFPARFTESAASENFLQPQNPMFQNYQPEHVEVSGEVEDLKPSNLTAYDGTENTDTVYIKEEPIEEERWEEPEVEKSVIKNEGEKKPKRKTLQDTQCIAEECRQIHNSFDYFCKGIYEQLKEMSIQRALQCQQRLMQVMTEERLSILPVDRSINTGGHSHVETQYSPPSSSLSSPPLPVPIQDATRMETSEDPSENDNGSVPSVPLSLSSTYITVPASVPAVSVPSEVPFVHKKKKIYSSSQSFRNPAEDPNIYEEENDDLAYFSRFVSGDLRKMECTQQRVIAKKLISDILFHGNFGDLTSSASVTCGTHRDTGRVIIPVSNPWES